MKTYFNNFPYTAESLKSEYRELCKKLHPDTGGSEEEFKAMAAEYEQISYNIDANNRRRQREQEEAEQRRQEEEARRQRQEEERRQREEEERRERERIEKAQEESRRKVAEWAQRLERVNNAGRRVWDFADKKAAAAFTATTKRNIKAVINYYFPGLKVKISISGKIWQEKFSITWEDGPSVADMEAIKELYYFIPSYYESDPYADYGDWKDNAGTRPWREAYGAALGDCTNIDFSRTLSDEGRQQADELASRIFANWSKDDDNGRGTFAGTLKEWVQLAEALGVKRNEYGGIDFYNAGMSWSRYANNDRTEDGHDVGDFYFSSVRRLIREKISIKPTEPKAKTPEFVPTYGPTYKAIKKALGQNVFFIYHKGTSSREEKELTIFEAAEILAAGGVVNLGHRAEYDGNPCIYATDRGGYKVQEKRNAKFAAVGVTLAAPSWNVYGCVSVVGITPDTAAALRAELADIERQRKAWEAGQAADKATEKATRRTKGTKAGNNTTDTANDAQKATNEAAGVDMDAAPADGLELVEIAGGVAVVGDSRTTFKNRKAIKARGARWNRDAQQWQATDPEAVAALRAWFGMDADTANDDQTAAANDAAESTQDAPQGNESTADGQTPADTPPDDATQAAETPQDETAPYYDACEISPILEAFANLFRVIVDTMEEAKKYEGVTVPADTLTRWKTEAETGAKSTAAQLAEVCACLGSLTPDSRKDFDALGVIFWTLSEQLRQGFNPDTIAPATDYARGQLFDLIGRTQHPNQAQAVRDATDPTHRTAA